MCPMMSAELSDAQSFGPIPKDWYTLRIDSAPAEKAKKGTGEMIAFVLTVQTGEHAKRKVFPPYRVMIGGLKEDMQTRHDIGRLCEMISVAKIEWKCLGCGASGVRPFVRNEQNKYLCPDCRQQTRFAYDSDHFVGKLIKGLVDQEKGLNDDMVNRVVRVGPMT